MLNQQAQQLLPINHVEQDPGTSSILLLMAGQGAPFVHVQAPT
jgi:hypothetical protein